LKTGYPDPSAGELNLPHAFEGFMEYQEFTKIATHLGVDIYLEYVEIAGSSFEIVDDVMINVTPSFDTYFTYFDSARYDNLNEVLEEIDKLFESHIENHPDGDAHSSRNEFAFIMNNRT
jgi:hypothetical protein